MKRLALLLLCLPAFAMAQTETKKVVQMSVVRSVGGIVNTYLTGDDDYIGPMYNRETENLVLKNTSGTTVTVARKRIKEIRFTIETIEVPTAIDAVEADELTAVDQKIYDLSGRVISPSEALTRGIYIKGGKKYVRK